MAADAVCMVIVFFYSRQLPTYLIPDSSLFVQLQFPLQQRIENFFLVCMSHKVGGLIGGKEFVFLVVISGITVEPRLIF